MEKYQGDFGSWDDVQREFRPEGSHWEDGRLDVPEPEDLIIASYTYESYDGDGNVLWRNKDGTFGYVNGGHCSCYGLEGQWKVEEYTKETLLGQFDRALESSYPCGFFNNRTLRDLIADL